MRHLAYMKALLLLRDGPEEDPKLVFEEEGRSGVYWGSEVRSAYYSCVGRDNGASSGYLLDDRGS